MLKKKPYGHAPKEREKKAIINMPVIEKGVFFKKKQVRKKALKRLGIENKEGGAGGQWEICSITSMKGEL